MAYRETSLSYSDFHQNRFHQNRTLRSLQFVVLGLKLWWYYQVKRFERSMETIQSIQKWLLYIHIYIYIVNVYIYIYIVNVYIYIYIYTKQLCDFKCNNKFIINTTISQSLAKSTKEPDALNEHMLLVSTRKVVGGIHHDISRTLGSFTKNHMATSMKPDETHESFPRFIYIPQK